MRARRFGRIVFLSSTAAFRGGVIGPHYAASKAGLHGLTYFLASRTAADGVTVNALAPGFVQTAMLPGDAGELGCSVRVGGVGTPAEIADFTLAVLRNGYLTGHAFGIDGGMHPRRSLTTRLRISVARRGKCGAVALDRRHSLSGLNSTPVGTLGKK